MKNIFIIGAGLSTISLIDYLLKNAPEYHWHVTVGDISLSAAEAKVANAANGRAIRFDIMDQKQRQSEISQADIVVSMLPGTMHQIVADECLSLGKHLLTPSYVTPEMKNIASSVIEKGLVFLNELGVDPGIDHMSAMRIIDAIKKKGGKIHSFNSFCGGLVAPACDDNPWNYKFSWNPRNVVVAGQGTARYRANGQNKYISYNRLFSTLCTTQMPGYGDFEIYPNRDSLQYCQLYGLEDIQTILRGTMRRPGFCEAWDIFVQLGCTDDSYVMEGSDRLTYRQYLECFLPADTSKGVEAMINNTLKSYLPFFKNYSTQWTDYELASELYSDKVVLLKSIEANITPVQKKRGGSLNKLLKRFSKEVIWADNYRYEIGNTILKTTIAVEHGVGKKFLGYVILPVIMYSIEKFMFVPDVYGPISSNVLDIILKEMPDVIYLDGPPLYLKDLGFGRISLRKVERNLESIIRNVSEMIIDHHVFRSKAGPKFIDSLKAKISNPHKILTVAEKIGVEPRLLEINRQLLWEEDPPTEDFINWTKLEPEIKRRTPPPLTS